VLFDKDNDSNKNQVATSDGPMTCDDELSAVPNQIASLTVPTEWHVWAWCSNGSARPVGKCYRSYYKCSHAACPARMTVEFENKPEKGTKPDSGNRTFSGLHNHDPAKPKLNSELRKEVSLVYLFLLFGRIIFLACCARRVVTCVVQGVLDLDATCFVF